LRQLAEFAVKLSLKPTTPAEACIANAHEATAVVSQLETCMMKSPSVRITRAPRRRALRMKSMLIGT
jgi:hypothetical protein